MTDSSPEPSAAAWGSHLGSGMSGLQDWERICFCGFRPPSLWHFAGGGLGKGHVPFHLLLCVWHLVPELRAETVFPKYPFSQDPLPSPFPLPILLKNKNITYFEGMEIVTLFSNYFVKYRFTIENLEIKSKIHLYSHHTEINSQYFILQAKKCRLGLFIEFCVNFCHLT